MLNEVQPTWWTSFFLTNINYLMMPIRGGCPSCLVPSSVGHNWFGQTYLGPNNPVSQDGSDNFSYRPTNLADYPPVGHDRRYFNVRASGPSGVFLNQKTIGADYKLVAEEFEIANMQGLPTNQRLTAAAVVIGIGFGALPKTINLLFTQPASGFA